MYTKENVLSIENHPNDSRVTLKTDGIVQTLNTRMGTGGGNVPLVLMEEAEKSMSYQDKTGTLTIGSHPGGVNGQDVYSDLLITEKSEINMDETNENTKYIVRRLTPKECERLQGFPDDWTNIPNASDTARYKALGNSIALPQWQWIIDRMADYLPEKATLGSLFDGIGGFPLCWENTHGKGTAIWASDIEKFCIEVTKYHFSETDWLDKLLEEEK